MKRRPTLETLEGKVLLSHMHPSPHPPVWKVQQPPALLEKPLPLVPLVQAFPLYASVPGTTYAALMSKGYRQGIELTVSMAVPLAWTRFGRPSWA